MHKFLEFVFVLLPLVVSLGTVNEVLGQFDVAFFVDKR